MSELHLAEALKAVDNAASICGDGKTDVKKILRTLVDGPQKEKKTYRPGQRFRVYDSGIEWKVMLSRDNTDGRTCLTVIDDPDAGHQLSGALYIPGRATITRGELNSLFLSHLFNIECLEDDS